MREVNRLAAEDPIFAAGVRVSGGVGRSSGAYLVGFRPSRATLGVPYGPYEEHKEIGGLKCRRLSFAACFLATDTHI